MYHGACDLMACNTDLEDQETPCSALLSVLAGKQLSGGLTSPAAAPGQVLVHARLSGNCVHPLGAWAVTPIPAEPPTSLRVECGVHWGHL